jgi:photosystem II stability/assembly factor-like uncharacterized protein
MKKIITSILVLSVLVIIIFSIKEIKGTENEITDNNPESYSSSQLSPQSGGWQLQVMPNMGSRLVRDLYFTDSLTGYAVASPNSHIDSAHILKTTNGGNNWVIKRTWSGRLLGIKFINQSTGFAGGNYFLKTTNAGENWVVWNWGILRIAECMYVFSEDTIWYGWTDPTSGGVYRTTNGGLNWEKRDNGIPANSYPIYIYFYNSRIGFATGNTDVYKTTNAGQSWFLVFSGGAQKLFFKDSLNGYRTSQGFFRTTNGGLNWSMDSLPSVVGNYWTNKEVWNFEVVGDGTIYALRGNFQNLNNFITRALIFKTTNWGLNWGYQIPDTSYGNPWYDVCFAIRNNVWAYIMYRNLGIYSPTGGDSTVYLGIQKISTEIPENYTLFQNYPNPFNPVTKIKIEISKHSPYPHLLGGSSISRGENTILKVYDITGKEINTLINEMLHPGTYEVSFDGASLPSGLYFYTLFVNGSKVDTKKAVLIK